MTSDNPSLDTLRTNPPACWPRDTLAPQPQDCRVWISEREYLRDLGRGHPVAVIAHTMRSLDDDEQLAPHPDNVAVPLIEWNYAAAHTAWTQESDT